MKRKRKLSQIQTIGLGFLVIILLGSLVLSLPFCQKEGADPTYFDCLFTAVSATCVTGLVTVDTFRTWTIAGQLAVLCMIQIGGLGFVTMGVYLSVILRSRIGLRQRSLLKESINASRMGGIVRLARMIIQGTALIEGAGAILLSFYFVPKLGLLKGLYYGIFHSVSAFCNAGFDLMGEQEAFSSFAGGNASPYVLIVLMLLILIGGIGFAVWQDVAENGMQVSKYTLHTKIVLAGTVVLVFGGGLLFLLMEQEGTLKGMSLADKAVHALFASVTARTAGFNSIDVASMSEGSMLLTMFLMVIGGCPGSTAGGIKVTTIAVLMLLVKSTIFREQGCTVFHRRLPDDSVRKATTVISINVSLILIGALIICMLQPLPLKDVMFEVTSAMGTVGMTTGITRELKPLSRIVVMLLMYCGRIGSLSFAFALFEHKHPAAVRMPKEDIQIG